MLVHRDRSTYTMSGGFWPNLKNTIQKYSKVIIMVMMNDFQDSLSSDYKTFLPVVADVAVTNVTRLLGFF